MPDPPPPREPPRRPNEPAGLPDTAAGFAPPHPNGAVGTTGVTRARRMRRRLFAGLFVVVVIAWGIALAYSVTADSPEHLDATDARQVGGGCSAALEQLKAIPQLPVPPTLAATVDRIEAENEILRAMVGKIAEIPVDSADKQRALSAWLDDWDGVLNAREKYAEALPDDPNVRLVIPAVRGIKPVTDRMNDWVTEQDDVVSSCNTETLEAEAVVGQRAYGSPGS